MPIRNLQMQAIILVSFLFIAIIPINCKITNFSLYLFITKGMPMQRFPTELCCNTISYNYVLITCFTAFYCQDPYSFLKLIYQFFCCRIQQQGMHDCCIRVTALLECFEWTHTTGQGEWRQPCYECQAVWGRLLVLLLRGVSHLHSIIDVIEKGCGRCASTFKTKKL